MSRTRAWRPDEAERIDWYHPYIAITKTAPGYLVQELFGYADSTWEKWLSENKPLWTTRNRRPWVYLTLLGRAESELPDGD